MTSAATTRAAHPDAPSVRRILLAAGALFARKGYHGASLADVAREAGVSKSLLHYHFESKEHLFLELQLLVFRDVLHQVQLLTTGSSRSVEQFHAALRQVLDFMEENVDTVAVLLEFRTVLGDSPTFGERLEQFHERVIALIVEGLYNTLGPMAGELVLPPERLARLLSTVFHGLLVDLSFAPSAKARGLIRQTFSDIQVLLARALLPVGRTSEKDAQNTRSNEPAAHGQQEAAARGEACLD